jgi:membrane fusion protein (multidrug efflux system)
VVVVPRTAVVYSLYGNSIYTLSLASADKSGRLYKVKQVQATLGPAIGSNIIVKSGIESGTAVVNSGQLKISNGATVRLDNSVKLNAMSPDKLKGS